MRCPFLGPQPLLERNRIYAEATVQRVDAEVEHLLEQAHQQARTVITEHREALERLVQALLQEEMDERAPSRYAYFVGAMTSSRNRWTS